MNASYRIILLAVLIRLTSSRPQNGLLNPQLRTASTFSKTFRIPPQTLSDEFHQRANRNSGQLTDAQKEEYERLQEENVMYQFGSIIEDNINGQTQEREEVRDGHNVKGMYSYSDGYFKRTVHYVADKDGYRVVSMEAVPLDGPRVDLKGTASVQNYAHGTELKYKVASVPIVQDSVTKV